MSVAALDRLKPLQPRRFVPERIDLGDWAQLEPLLQRLDAEGAELPDAQALEAWLLRVSEFGAALYQEEARRYINMTCQTDDPASEAAFLAFVEQIEPRLKPWLQKLDQRYLACPHRAKLPPSRYEVFDRDTRKDVELFREENVPLQTEQAKLAQQYQKTMGAMTVTFRGEELTVLQAGRYLEEPERATREQVYRLISERRLQDRERIEELYEQLLGLRERIGRNAGFGSFREYAFKSNSRFDYTPADCEAFHDAVERHVVPLARKLQERRRRIMGLEQLRPWDLGVDPRGRPPLRPFQGAQELAEKSHEIFRRIDPSLGDDFKILIERELLDLESRKGKAPGGYQHSLEEARLPFIFMNAVGLQRDVQTLLHEGGHAFHALAMRQEPLLSYRHPPLEFCEVASMSMELLAGPHLEVFYAKENADRARRTHREEIVALLPWIATIDAFQHWVYTHAGHTRAERRDAWLATRRRFGGIEDWSGLEEAEACLWHKQGHLFGAPFYYIEYGIAQLGALQVWLNYLNDPRRALAQYRAGLALGRSRPLPELFAAAGIRFDFSAAAVKPLAEVLERELARLEEA
ncbi:MAG: M3 family oligoendopeptidase [Planctomycetota bacterium]|nr:M3 family oligoendopeptidase [Planctomycetota bacterium]